jgi:predicted nucleotide-binding protein
VGTNLDRDETALLKACFENSFKEKSKFVDVQRATVELIKAGMTQEEVQDSLDVLLSRNFIDEYVGKKGSGRIHTIRMTPSGFETYGRLFLPELDKIINGAIDAIVNKGLKNHKEIAEYLNKSVILIEYIFDLIKDKQLINAAHFMGSDADYVVTQVSTEAKKAVKRKQNIPVSQNGEEKVNQTISEKMAKRNRVLVRVYTESGGSPFNEVSDDVIVEKEEVTHEELVNEIQPYLYKKGWIKYMGFKATTIDEGGIDIAEELLSKQNNSSHQETREVKMSQPVPSDPAKVFVVHGRNSKAVTAMFDFLSSIGLKPLEWSQAKKATGKPSPSIPEILDTAFSIAGAVVVLFTPDEMTHLREELRGAKDKDEDFKPSAQSRPNVLFEAGIAMGRYPDRTVLVELGEVRPFTDISGIHVVKLNNSGESRQDLVDSLENAKCPVDISGRRWHRVGDFDAALEGL